MAEFFTPNPGQSFLTGDDAGITNDTAGQGETNNLICDRTGFRVSVREGLKREWNGRMVRAASWEARHPLDYIRARTTERSKGSPRPESDDVFIDGGYIMDESGQWVLAESSYPLQEE